MPHVCRRVRDAECDAPVRRCDVCFIYTAGGRDVLAARECGRGTRTGIPKQCVFVHRRRELSAVDSRDLLRDAECLVAVVGDKDCRDVLHREDLTQCRLDLPLEMCVECRERFVEEQQICAACEDACKGDALLLTARESRRIGVFKSLK